MGPQGFNSAPSVKDFDNTAELVIFACSVLLKFEHLATSSKWLLSQCK